MSDTEDVYMCEDDEDYGLVSTLIHDCKIGTYILWLKIFSGCI